MMAQMVVWWRPWSRMAQHQCHQSLLPSREQRGRDRERSTPRTPLHPHPHPAAASSTEVASSHLSAKEPFNYGFIFTHLSGHSISSLSQMNAFYICYMKIMRNTHVSEQTCFTLPMTDSPGFFALHIIPLRSHVFPSSILCLTKGVEDPNHNQSR